MKKELKRAPVGASSMEPQDRDAAMAIRVKQLEGILLRSAQAADRGASDVTLAMAHDSGRGRDPNAHLEPIVTALHEAVDRGRLDGAKERNDLRSKLEGMARSRDKWQAKYEAFTQAAGMKPLRSAHLELIEAVRAALHTLQDPMRGFVGRCLRDLPHDHKDLQTVREAMRLLNAAHDKALEAIRPRGSIEDVPKAPNDE